MGMSFSLILWATIKIHQKLCSYSKITHNPYVSWCKIWLNTDPLSSICHPKRSFYTSIHTPIPRPLDMIHSIHRCLRWHQWSSIIIETHWQGTTSCIPLTYIHGHSMQMQLFLSPTKRQTLLFMSLLTTTFQFTCVPGTYCLMMEWNSKINLWTIYSNNLILIIFSLPHSTHSAMENWRYSTSI